MEDNDETLEPGDIVELVKMEPLTGLMRVRTLDEHHPIEGVVPESYLRKKDSMKGDTLESKCCLTEGDLVIVLWGVYSQVCTGNTSSHPYIVCQILYNVW